MIQVASRGFDSGFLNQSFFNVMQFQVAGLRRGFEFFYSGYVQHPLRGQKFETSFKQSAFDRGLKYYLLGMSNTSYRSNVFYTEIIQCSEQNLVFQVQRPISLKPRKIRSQNFVKVIVSTKICHIFRGLQKGDFLDFWKIFFV